MTRALLGRSEAVKAKGIGIINTKYNILLGDGPNYDVSEHVCFLVTYVCEYVCIHVYASKA